MHLVDGWRQCHKWHSVQVLAGFAALQLAYITLPARVHDDLPSWATEAIALLLTAGAIIGRLVAQPNVETPNVQNPVGNNPGS